VTADISDRIEACAHSGSANPDQNEIGCRTMLSGQKNPRQVLWRFGDRTWFVDPADDLIAGRWVLRPGACGR
jgi:hypothetical protein